MIQVLHLVLLALVVCRESQHARRAAMAYFRVPLSWRFVIDLLPVTPFLYYFFQLIELTGHSMSA